MSEIRSAAETSALVLLGRASADEPGGAPSGWLLLTWPIAESNHPGVRVRRRSSVRRWFTEYQGYPSGITPEHGPLELQELPPLPSGGLDRLSLALFTNDWEAIASLPAILASAELQDVQRCEVWLVFPDRDPRGESFPALRELNVAWSHTTMQRASWYLMDRPSTVTGLTREIAAVRDILQLEQMIVDRGGEGFPRGGGHTQLPLAAMLRTAGGSLVDSRASLFADQFSRDSLAWLHHAIPPTAAALAHASGSELSDRWLDTWGWDAQAFGWMPRWYTTRLRIEAHLAEEVWTGGGWNRQFERAALGPVGEFIDKLGAGTPDKPPGSDLADESDDGENDRLEGAEEVQEDTSSEDRTDAGGAEDEPPTAVASAEDEVPPPTPALQRELDEFRSALPRLIRTRGVPGPMMALEDDTAEGYRRFLSLKAEELRLRLNATGEEAEWPSPAELERLSRRAQRDPEPVWAEIRDRLRPVLERLALSEVLSVVEALARSWDGLNALAQRAEMAAGPVRGAWRVALRMALGLADWPSFWRRFADRALTESDGNVERAWTRELVPLSALGEAEWLELHHWGAVLEAIEHREDVDEQFWRLCGSRNRFAADAPTEWVEIERRTRTVEADKSIEALRRSLEPRCRIGGDRAATVRRCVSIERPERIPPDRAAAFMPDATIIGPDQPAEGLLACGISWTEPMGLDAYQLFADSWASWNAAHPPPPYWQPAPSWAEQVDPERERRASAAVMLEALRLRCAGELVWDAGGVLTKPAGAESGLLAGWLAARARQLVDDPAILKNQPPVTRAEIGRLTAAEDSIVVFDRLPPLLRRLLNTDTQVGETTMDATIHRALRPRRIAPWAKLRAR